ncbi:ATP-binding protein [Actinacidiphila bryophytorum]|uniref:ATP-binding protein n=1 Tax=Actinacidiphila bryophytorum TaxID=1436133 RepID=UPI002176D7D5|nr:ATP-binding protein [Actinacidiphila bryophytorum]UWE12403.1 ATP-binding protein [Actinacidiphila bryophytorum]
MSLPLPRRIARAALLVGAAAAPLVAAGAAHAATPDPAVSGLTALDGATLKGTSLGSASAAQATDAAGRIVGATAESLPVTGALPNTGALPTTDQLPLKALPLG